MARHTIGIGCLLTTLLTLHPAHGAIQVQSPQCEYLDNPLAIHESRPKLSWTLSSDTRNASPSAYQVLVATAPDKLAPDKADRWDSGKVSSADLSCLYAGKPLASRETCWWRVRVWDQDGKPSAWSEPARWTMGLLGASDWRAKWIMHDPAGPTDLNDCSWVWFPEGDPVKAAPVGRRYFRKVIPLPKEEPVAQARFVGAADNEFVLYVGGKPVGKGVDWNALTSIDVTRHLVGGRTVIGIEATNGGTTPNPAALVGKLVIRLADNQPRIVRVDETWKASKRKHDGWLNESFDDGGWANAKPLGKVGMKPWGKLGTAPGPMPIFRRGFAVGKPVRRATAYICGLGFYELRLNGEKVGERALDPGWTNYRKRCLYVAHDVTANVKSGKNALGVLLGNGMYNVPGGRYIKFRGSFGPPKLICQLHVDYQDGTSEVIASDASWKATSGPIVFSCIYGGEDYDARLEQPGWDSPGFNDARWSAAIETKGPGGALAAQMAPAIRVIQSFQPVKVTEATPEAFIYDFGQNASAWPRVQFRGPAGATIKLVPGELLDDKGLVTQRSSGGPSWFQYTLKGEGVETWHPRFTYYGFRWVQVVGAVPKANPARSGEPVLLSIASEVVHSSAAPVGTFECSNKLFNRTHEIITWAIRSNMQSVLTDCPHREKLGWLEEAHLMGPSVMYNFRVPNLYRKIFQDMAASQLDNGLVPDIAPEYVVFHAGFRDSPEWGSACVISPWQVYEQYGEVRPLRRHYETMKRYVAYLGSRAKNHIVDHGLGDWCDIGPKSPGRSQLTPIALTATAVYFRDIVIVQKVAEILGRTDDARRYADLAAKIRDAFNAKFFHADTAQYAKGSQTANAMPLVFGMVPAGAEAKVLNNLVKDVRAHGNHMTAGDVGHRFLILALAQNGRSDVVFDMTNQTEAPSYGNQIKHGATSLTEAWDGRANLSQNHFMLGHVEEWFYKYVLGIRNQPGSRGFEKILIHPHPVGDLTWAKGSYRSVRGLIRVHWRREGEALSLDVNVPVGSTARVVLPTKTFDVGSGQHRLTSK